ncbi:MAG: iron ABC transporter permease [Bacteroidetes bacterium]|nr:iron ABC transporter permease [Bacteroidota bacterium]
MNKHPYIKNTLLLGVLVALAFACDLVFGSVNLFSFKDSVMQHTILFDIRLPKALTSLFAGSALALCGLLMQSLFRNPLAGPYVLGISSGASLFVSIAIIALNLAGLSSFYYLGKSLITLSSIGGALVVTAVITYVANRSRNNITVLLVGIMLAQILGALQGLIEFIASAESLKSFVVWSMGSVGNTSFKDLWLIMPLCLAVFAVAFTMARPLNALLLNEQYARNLGVNVDKTRIRIILVTAILTGVITAFCGPIAFVGISVPIMCRLLFKTPNHLHQITYCILMGAVVLLGCDVITQVISSAFTVPINTITTIVGSPIVIWLIFKTRFAQS